MVTSHTTPMNKQSLFINVLLMGGTLIISLLGIEIFCYAYLKIPAHMPPLVYFDPSQKPSKRLMRNATIEAFGAYREFRYQISTNDLGFRNTYPFTSKGDAENYSVVFLGDSQTFGVGVDDQDTFTSLFARNLNLSVLNAACPGYNTIEELLTYTHRIKPFYKPEHIVLFFFAGNDAYENHKNHKLFNKLESPSSTESSQNPSPPRLIDTVKNFLSKRSAIYNLFIRIRQFPQINQLLYHYKLVKATPPSELAIFKRSENQEALAHWQITEEVIKTLKDKVATSGSTFWIVLIPDRYQVDATYWQQWVSKYNLDSQDFDLMLPNRHLAEFATKHGIVFVDPTESLRKSHAQGENPFWKIDSHLNPSGHQIIAKLLTARMSEYQQSSKQGL